MYQPLWHVRLADKPDRDEVALLVIGEWRFPNGVEQWCVEYLDAGGGELDEDVYFGSEAEARAHAEAQFSFSSAAWQPGFPKNR